MDLYAVNYDLPHKAAELLDDARQLAALRTLCSEWGSSVIQHADLIVRLSAHPDLRRHLAIDMDLAYQLCVSIKHTQSSAAEIDSLWYLLHVLCLNVLDSTEMAQFVLFRLSNASPAMLSFLAHAVYRHRLEPASSLSSVSEMALDNDPTLSLSMLEPYLRTPSGKTKTPTARSTIRSPKSATNVARSAQKSSPGDWRMPPQEIFKRLQAPEAIEVLQRYLVKADCVRSVLTLLVLLSTDFCVQTTNIEHVFRFVASILASARQRMDHSYLLAGEILELEQCALLLDSVYLVAAEYPQLELVDVLHRHPQWHDVVGHIRYFVRQKSDDRLCLVMSGIARLVVPAADLPSSPVATMRQASSPLRTVKKSPLSPQQREMATVTSFAHPLHYSGSEHDASGACADEATSGDSQMRQVADACVSGVRRLHTAWEEAQKDRVVAREEVSRLRTQVQKLKTVTDQIHRMTVLNSQMSQQHV